MSISEIINGKMEAIEEEISKTDLYIIKSFGGKNYCHVSDGKNLIYVQVDRIPFEVKISLDYMPSTGFGSGCELEKIDFNAQPDLILFAIKQALKREVPYWVYIGKKTRPKKWDSLQAYLKSKGISLGNYELYQKGERISIEEFIK